jgi:hypothetical protein
MLGGSYLGQTYVGQPLGSNEFVWDFSESLLSSDSANKTLLTSRKDTTTISDSVAALIVRVYSAFESVNVSDVFSKVFVATKNFLESVTSGDLIKFSIVKIIKDTMTIGENFKYFLSKIIKDTSNIIDLIKKKKITSFTDNFSSSDASMPLLIKGFIEQFRAHDTLRRAKNLSYSDNVSSRDYIYIFKNGLSIAWAYLYKIVNNAWADLGEIKNTIWHTKYKK